MKRFLLAIAIVGTTNLLEAQTSWQYDFDISTGSLTSGSNIINSDGTSSGTAFLPAPQVNPNESLQSARVRLPSDGTGSFEFVTSGTTLGSGSRLLIKGGSSTSKFSIYNFEGTNLASASFKVRFNQFSAGQWIFALGKNDGTNNTYNGNSALPSTETEVFAGLRWVNQEDGSIKFYSRTDGATWSANNRYVFNPNTDYKIEVFCNNSVNAASYNKGEQNYNITGYSYHVWVNDVRVETAASDYNFTKGGLPQGAIISDLFFYGTRSSSTSTVYPTAYVDDFLYANYLSELTLPVELLSFSAQKNASSVQLNWSTASEQNSAVFIVERSADGKNFEAIATVKAAGNTNEKQFYSYEDNKPIAGTSYYRLVQYDKDGKYKLYDAKAVEFDFLNKDFVIINTAEPSGLSFKLNSNIASRAEAVLSNIQGSKILSQTINIDAGEHIYELNNLPLGSGVYAFSLKYGNKVYIAKIIK